MSTKYIATFQGTQAPADLGTFNWKPWTNVPADRDQLLGMVANRFVMDRGGILPEEKSIELTAMVRDTMALPCVVNSYVLKVSR